jgi:hypothetical protein
VIRQTVPSRSSMPKAMGPLATERNPHELTQRESLSLSFSPSNLIADQKGRIHGFSA